MDKDKKIQVLTRKIEKVINESGKNINIGIYIQEMNAGKILYKRNDEHYFNPASNEKLLIAFAALRYLGPDFTYSTNLYVDSTKIRDGTLEDNIYFKFSGSDTTTNHHVTDPYLFIERSFFYFRGSPYFRRRWHSQKSDE